MDADYPELHAPPPSRTFLPVESERIAALAAQNFASFWRRLVAAILDGLLMGVIGLGFRALLASLPFRDLPVVEVLYSIGFIAAGATPGMRALGIRVVDGAGNPPGLKRALLRYIIPALSWVPALIVLSSPGFFLDLGAPIMIVIGAGLTVLGLLDPLWMIWDAHKQTLHDKLASTFVVNSA